MSVTSDWGYWRVSASGVDVSSYRGAPHKTTFQLLEPFGCGPGTLTVPALSPLENLDVLLTDTGDRVFHEGAIVNVWRFHPDGTTRTRMWSGKLGQRSRDISSTQGRITWTLVGDMEEAGRQNWQPPADMDPADIGDVIPAALNSVIGRRYHAIPHVTTGIMTTNRGSDDMNVLSYVQELLSTATTADGASQWTIRKVPDSLDYEMVLKDRDTVQWNVTAGGFGVQPSIQSDLVPSRWFGQGVNKDGGWWGNWKYPGASADAAPDYPFASPSTTMTIGTTDADTASGDGVSVLQQRMNDLGYSKDVAIDGVFSASDAAAVKQVQEQLGLTVDGIVGGQTWTGTFNVGGGATLGEPIRLPLAWVGSAIPRLYNADGSDAGPNPTYDPVTAPPVVDVDMNMGSGVSKAEGRASIRAQFFRDWPAGHLGNLTLRLDPEEGSKFDIQAGDNIRIKHLGGGNPEFHIAGVQVDCDTGVTLAVDQKARDLLSITQILQRKRENSVNPARIPKGSKNRRATQTHDAVTPFDAESPAGVIPEFAIFAGLWSVIHIPVSQSGRVARVRMSSAPNAKWAMAMFGAPVTPAQLTSWVGNPFGDTRPWDDAQTDLENHTIIETWGSKDAACGQGPSTTDTDGDLVPGAVTGNFKDDGGFEYRSTKPPWVWIAVYSPTSTRLKGRLYPAPMDQ